MREVNAISQESFSKNVENSNTVEQSRNIAAAAWAEIGNQTRKPVNNAGDADSIYISAIFKDEDSVTRCVGLSSPSENYLKCKTTDFAPPPNKHQISGHADFGNNENEVSSVETPRKPEPKPLPDKPIEGKPGQYQDKEVTTRYTSAI